MSSLSGLDGMQVYDLPSDVWTLIVPLLEVNDVLKLLAGLKRAHGSVREGQGRLVPGSALWLRWQCLATRLDVPTLLGSYKALSLSQGWGSGIVDTEEEVVLLRDYAGCLRQLSAVTIGDDPYPSLRCLLPSLTRLHSLTLQNQELSSASWRLLESLPVLRELDLSNTAIAAHVPQPDFGGTPVPGGTLFARDAGRHVPAFAHSLEKLNLGTSSNVLHHLYLPSLVALRSLSCRILHHHLILEVALCPQLTELTLLFTRVCPLRIYGEAWRAVLSRLRTLSLVGCDLLPRPHLLHHPTEVVREAAAAAPSLTCLRLEDIQDLAVDDTLLRDVMPFARGLTALELTGARAVTDRGLAKVLEACGPALQRLQLHGAASRIHYVTRTATADPTLLISDASLLEMSQRCIALTHLHVSYAPLVTDTGVRALLRSPAAAKLRSLQLSGCSIVSCGTLHAIAQQCRSLKSLHIRGCHAAAVDAEPARGISGQQAIAALQARGVIVHYNKPVTALDNVPAAGMRRIPDVSFWVEDKRLSTEGAAATQQRQQLCHGVARTACPHGCAQGILDLPGEAADHTVVCPAAPTPCILAWLGCSEVLPRRDLGAHLQVCPHYVCDDTHGMRRHGGGPAAAQELRVCCPLAHDGCSTRAAYSRCGDSGDSGDSISSTTTMPHVEVSTHLQHCNHASYLCASCGKDSGSVRRSSCGTAECYAAGLRRGRMACFVHGTAKDAARLLHPPPPPPPPAATIAATADDGMHLPEAMPAPSSLLAGIAAHMGAALAAVAAVAEAVLHHPPAVPAHVAGAHAEAEAQAAAEAVEVALEAGNGEGAAAAAAPAPVAAPVAAPAPLPPRVWHLEAGGPPFVVPAVLLNGVLASCADKHAEWGLISVESREQ